MYRLTARQSSWLRTAETADRAAFLAQGPAEATALYDTSEKTEAWIPTVRGVAISDVPSRDRLETAAAAEAARARFQADAGSHQIDEVALGIDDTARQLDQALDERTMVITAILPLAGLTTDNLSDGLTDLLEDIDRPTVAAWTWLPSFARYLHIERPPKADGEAYDERRHCALDAPGGRDDQAAIEEAFVQALIDDRAYGFLAVAKQPIAKWNGATAQFSWGHVRSDLHYGRTPEQAIQAALAWGAEAWTRDQAAA